VVWRPLHYVSICPLLICLRLLRHVGGENGLDGALYGQVVLQLRPRLDSFVLRGCGRQSWKVDYVQPGARVLVLRVAELLFTPRFLYLELECS